MTPIMDGPPNFITHQISETPVTHAVDITVESLRRQHSHVQSPQTQSVAGSPQIEIMEFPSDRGGAAPIKQLSELDMELSKLIPKGAQQAQPAVSQQQAQVKLYSEVVRQQSITVQTNEPQNVCITTIGGGDDVSSTKGNEEPQTLNPPPLVRKVSRFQVSTVVEQQQQQVQQVQQQQNQVEEKAVLITQPNQTNTGTATVQQSMPEANITYQPMPNGKFHEFSVKRMFV